MSSIPKDSRIAIIGAGPAGLAAAERLKALGYHNCTLFEKSDHPGGMSLSKYYRTPDGREIAYELGSFQPTSSKNLYHLIKKANLTVGKQNISNTSNIDDIKIKIYSLKKRCAIVDFSKYSTGYPWSQLPAIFPQVIRLLSFFLKYHKLNKPGYLEIDPSKLNFLSMSYEKWLDQMNFKSMDVVLRMMGSIATFSNPKPRMHVPLIANVKVFLNLLMPPTRYINGNLKYVKEGYQELWNRIAKDHHIKLNSRIIQVTRTPKEVEIQLENETLTFDKIIITCSLTQALTFLDVTAEEQTLFNKVHYSPGWRVAFLGKNLPHDGLYSFIEPYLENDNATPGLQTFYPEGQVDDATWLYTSVFNFDQPDAIDALFPAAEKMLHDQFGGTVVEWLNNCYWPEYVPYFFGEDIKNNIFQKLENLQGINNTYYLGGTLSGSAQAVVIDYAYDRINKHFG